MATSTTKPDEITLVIEEAIVSGELMPGTVLRQELLSEEFGVSRTPVREALRQLAALGLVELEPNRGARVRAVSRDELREAFLIRAELERLAAELACPRIKKADLRRLRDAEERFAELTQRLRARAGDEIERRYLTAEWVRANDAFHNVFLEAAQMPLLARMAKGTRRIFHGQAAWSTSPEINELYMANLREHEAIRKAFETRDEAVGCLVRDHILNSGALLDRLLAEAATTRRRLLPLARSSASR